MISTKTLVRIARKWQNLAVSRRKKLPLPRKNGKVEVDNFGTTFVASKGCFTVYSNDGRRFVIPLVYLNNVVLGQLFKMSEEEFGLQGNGPITLPCDASLMEYIISLIQRGVAEDLEEALVISVCEDCCKSSFFHPGHTSRGLVVY
ncbi:hypothetical protein RJ639_031090 [Escallonia herrerae]|uniref:Uncharacterized protein n=1 Tax=Escallonia herrerae TaxID=1293975 RepID=A0AA88X207_9ASTE|nr:hypothetical protein RJ639_031090 [Escallonia herrerae]